MASYNFSTLTPQDFEDLARDVAQHMLGVEVETFSAGRDGGIDFRYSKNTGDIIIQAKHIGKFSNLLSKMKKEAGKVKILNPKRYILICSTPLTPPNKREISELFDRGLLMEDDIKNQSDLVNLLDHNPDLVKRHHKLWPFTAAMLEAILHNKTKGRSLLKREMMLQKLKYHVPTKNFTEAENILHDRGMLIVSGIPGIGKTTLADMLALSYLGMGYELVYVNSVKEAEEMIHPERKQFFYYDDFLGKNGLKELGEIDDSNLGFFLKNFKTDSNSRLVMTTREYILRQGRQVIEALDKKSTDQATCVIELDDYTRYQKARILYNHLFHSDLTRAEKESLLNSGNYLKVIDHPNYNPRLIEAITQTDTFKSEQKGTFYERFIAILDDPKELWEKAFAKSIRPSSQYLLYCLLAASDPVELDELRRQYDQVVEYSDHHLLGKFKKDEFEESLKELRDSFISIEVNPESNHMVSFANPSIRDYLLNHVEEKDKIILCLFSTATRLAPLLSIFAAVKSKSNTHNLLLGRQSGKDKIVIPKELLSEIEEILNDRLLAFKDVSGAELRIIVRRCWQLIAFWKSKLPSSTKKLIREQLLKVPVERLFQEEVVSEYLSIAESVKLDQKRIKDLVLAVVERVHSDGADIEDASVLAFLDGKISEVVGEVLSTTGISIKEDLYRIVSIESEESYDLTEAAADEKVAAITYIENQFGLDFSSEKEAITEAVGTDFEPDNDYLRDYGDHFVEDPNSDKAVHELFNTLKED